MSCKTWLITSSCIFDLARSIWTLKDLVLYFRQDHAILKFGLRNWETLKLQKYSFKKFFQEQDYKFCTWHFDILKMLRVLFSRKSTTSRLLSRTLSLCRIILYNDVIWFGKSFISLGECVINYKCYLIQRILSPRKVFLLWFCVRAKRSICFPENMYQ